MSLPLLISAITALLAGPADTTRGVIGITTPTVKSTPVTGIRSRVVADSVVVEKSRRTLTLYQAGFPVRSYGIALGKVPQGDKVQKGDGRTPEGLFYIDSRNPASKYHRSLHISYPDVAHRARANALGVEAGGDVMIHGLPKGYEKFGAQHREWDWTEGCVAVTNEEIEEIWRAIPDGTPIQIKP
jgi:murein L,D-transpeptidase YafK